MRDYAELSKSVHCCVGCEESQCEICPRGDTPFSYIECKRKLADDAADAIEELLAAVPKWVNVEERLPEQGERVLVSNGGFICESYLSQSGKWQRGGVDMFFMTPTHWMPLLKPPKEENKR